MTAHFPGANEIVAEETTVHVFTYNIILMGCVLWDVTPDLKQWNYIRNKPSMSVILYMQYLACFNKRDILPQTKQHTDNIFLATVRQQTTAGHNAATCCIVMIWPSHS